MKLEKTKEMLEAEVMFNTLSDYLESMDASSLLEFAEAILKEIKGAVLALLYMKSVNNTLLWKKH